MTKKKKDQEEPQEIEEITTPEPPFQINLFDPSALSPPPSRMLNMFGDLDEEKVENICTGLLYLKDTCCEERLVDPDDPDGEVEIIKNPIDFCISTWGGDALGMFAIYDLMRMIREECDINTIGIGKVMSAGVLLLAAGTKGTRKVGKNTRIMMHAVRGGHYGALHSLENEMKETKWLQEQHIAALIAETSMTKRQINTMLNKRVDIYLSAEEAVEMGIADIII